MLRGISRTFTTTTTVAKDALKSFDKHFPTSQKQKPWEKARLSKDEYFMRRYNLIDNDKRQALTEKVQRQKRARKQRRENEKQGSNYKSQSYESQTFESEGSRRTPIKNPLREYVYGTHPVLSSLTARKRHLIDRLFVHNAKDSINDILRLAKAYNIKVESRNKNDLNILTNNGVHNGVVLETSPLEWPYIALLGEANNGSYNVNMDTEGYSQSIEKPVARKGGKYPLGIYLDEVTDPQNVGAIVRSAYYLGVDFIIVPSHSSARMGPAAAKASAGALDLLDIYQTRSGFKMVRELKLSLSLSLSLSPPWTIIAAGTANNNNPIDPSQLSSVLDESPVLLILGSEGLGIRTNLLHLADFSVTIDNNRDIRDSIVDSLNVGVASAVLISRLVG